MEMHQFVSPPLGNNVYLLWEGMPGKGAVIDPAMATDDILFYAKEHRIKILYIVNTHAHFDHVWENAKLKKATGAKLCIGKGDERLLLEADKLVPPHLRAPMEKVKADRVLKEKDTIKFGNATLQVLHTPGHTPGSICLYNEKEKVLFTGDTLFASTYGRTDLPHGNAKQMEKTLERLAKLPLETTVFPGHGAFTKIGRENWLGKSAKKK
ncbi:MAG TPA: MBL fold metallo-hydrolase [Candidatus Bilamarchaeaceae archaeon]|nr:MBL fold metallo-hydrolase [Candidatus Bilamarchaeaceae archaeon]